MADKLAPTLALRNGAAIPVIGLGTWPSKRSVIIVAAWCSRSARRG